MKIVDGKLVIELPLNPNPQPTESSKGKNLNVASTGGFMAVAGLTYMGKQVKVNVNAIIPSR